MQTNLRTNKSTCSRKDALVPTWFLDAITPIRYGRNIENKFTGYRSPDSEAGWKRQEMYPSLRIAELQTIDGPSGVAAHWHVGIFEWHFWSIRQQSTSASKTGFPFYLAFTFTEIRLRTFIRASLLSLGSPASASISLWALSNWGVCDQFPLNYLRSVLLPVMT